MVRSGAVFPRKDRHSNIRNLRAMSRATMTKQAKKNEKIGFKINDVYNQLKFCMDVKFTLSCYIV